MPQLQLPKTKLSYEDGCLVKHGKDDAVIATFERQRIRNVTLVTRSDFPVATVLILMCLALAWVAQTYVASEAWSVGLTILFVAMALLSCLAIFSKRIAIETNTGSVEYPIADQNEEAEGFVLALGQALEDDAQAQASVNDH